MTKSSLLTQRLVVMIAAITVCHLILEAVRLYTDFQPAATSIRRRNDAIAVGSHNNNITVNNSTTTNNKKNITSNNDINENTLQNKAPSILPNRLITVFGLESSGTTFMATTLAEALGKTPNHKDSVHYRWKNGETEIQHLSEPWGWFASEKSKLPQTVDVLLPDACMMVLPHGGMDAQKMLPQQDQQNKAICQQLGVSESPLMYPHRFFVNVTSHIRWYRERGVEATAIIVVRDVSAHYKGVLGIHLSGNNTAAKEQYHVGRHLLVQALEQLKEKEEVILVSYETVMSLRDEYLLKLYDDLGIKSTYLPEFKDGNAKHVKKR